MQARHPEFINAKHPAARRRERGSLLIEVSLSMGFASLLALLLMKASLLSLSGNQWSVMQTLTDAFLTRETALANRLPLALITAEDSPWPESSEVDLATWHQQVYIGKIAGGTSIPATLTRFRVNETPIEGNDTGFAVWRLHSVLRYSVGDKTYVKSRSTLRMQ